MTQPLAISTSYTSFLALRIADDHEQEAPASGERSVARVVSIPCDDKGLSPRAISVDPSTPDYSPDGDTYLVITGEVPWRVTSHASFYRDVPGSLQDWPSGTDLWPARGS